MDIIFTPFNINILICTILCIFFYVYMNNLAQKTHNVVIVGLGLSMLFITILICIVIAIILNFSPGYLPLVIWIIGSIGLFYTIYDVSRPEENKEKI